AAAVALRRRDFRSYKLTRGGRDALRVDAVRVHELGRLAGAGNLAYGELHDLRLCVDLRERGQDGVSEAAFWIVVLDRDDAPGLFGSGLECERVDRLDRVGVDHPRADVF